MNPRLCLLPLLLTVSEAAVVKVEVTQRSAVAHGYESLRGRAFFAVDPREAGNREITDIQHAPRNAAGLVEFSADVHILQPVDSAKSNHTVLFEVVNRGKKNLLTMFNRATAGDLGSAASLGDGKLLQEGYTLVWLGWQHDVPETPGLMRLYAPAAQGVRGLVRAEYLATGPIQRFPLGDVDHIAYRPLQSAKAALTVRDAIDAPRRQLAPEAWHFEKGTEVVLTSPAVMGSLYEVVYEATDPVIAGLGLAGIRDLVSHLKGQRGIQRAIGFGVSQSAMVLRALLYEGFNQDERGALVFDAIFAHVAGARRATFQRFVQPSRTAGPLRNASFSSTEQFPYTDADLLARARKAHVVPKIFYTNSSYEYWGSGASLLHTSDDGTRDVPLPETTRLYMLAGGQHGPAAFPPQDVGGRNLPNFNDYRWALRALLAPLQRWIESGAEPPASVYPTLASRTLVPLSQYAFRSAPTPKEIHTPHVLDFGRDYQTSGVATHEPPRVLKRLTTLVPQADAGGNDLGGIRMPEVQCAIAAYTGWNLRSEKIGASRYLLANVGSYVPFSNAEISRSFPAEGNYLSCVNRAASSLAKQGFLLSADLPKVIESATQHWRWRTQQRSLSSLQNAR